MDALRTGALLAATLTTAVMAGLFYAYSCSVLPALRGADAAVLVEVMQRINRAILNGWFVLCFVGAAMGTVMLGPTADWLMRGMQALLPVKRRVRAAIIEFAQSNGTVASGDEYVAPRPTHQELAERVGSTRVVVSRVIKELLDEEEAIRMDGRTLRVRLDGRAD